VNFCSKVPVHTTSLIDRPSEKHGLLFEYFYRICFLVTFVANSGPRIQRRHTTSCEEEEEKKKKKIGSPDSADAIELLKKNPKKTKTKKKKKRGRQIQQTSQNL
jgi:hypothetical protein